LSPFLAYFPKNESRLIKPPASLCPPLITSYWGWKLWGELC
jgi:hypothetical protein